MQGLENKVMFLDYSPLPEKVVITRSPLHEELVNRKIATPNELCVNKDLYVPMRIGRCDDNYELPKTRMVKLNEMSIRENKAWPDCETWTRHYYWDEESRTIYTTSCFIHRRYKDWNRDDLPPEVGQEYEIVDRSRKRFKTRRVEVLEVNEAHMQAYVRETRMGRLWWIGWHDALWHWTGPAQRKEMDAAR